MWLRNRLGFVLVCGVFEVFCQETPCYPKACRKSDNQKIVCGSDGLSYPNRCQLERVRCHNLNVTMVKRGPCKRQRTCLEWEDLSLDFPQYKFKARCKQNGAYETGQCHPESGYCWCVTPEGIPLPDTVREKNKKPGSKPIRCGGSSRKKIARSPSRKKNRACKLSDKSQLNNNLINSFHSEYFREMGGQNNSDQTVIRWKFTNLDSNRDQMLDKREYRDIKRIVTKAMKPKKCAKLFPKSCDVDSDGRITLQEWGDCLNRDGYTVATDGTGGGKSTTEILDSGGGDSDDYDTSYDPIPAPPHGVLSSDLGVPPLSNYDDDIIETREEDSPGCLGDRKVAMEEGSTHNATYIPECTPDGRYKKVQCYKSVGYCWCVNEDTGDNIPGTAFKGKMPNCDLLKPTPRPMKGCPDDKKIIFLQELQQFLHSKMAENATPKSPIALIQSNEEQALWSFNFLDHNKNKVLERTEWRIFKEMMAPIKGLKKCGKKFPRYCDSNKDKEITTTEWLDCLNIQAAFSSASRSGKTNPLRLLKDD